MQNAHRTRSPGTSEQGASEQSEVSPGEIWVDTLLSTTASMMAAATEATNSAMALWTIGVPSSAANDSFGQGSLSDTSQANVTPFRSLLGAKREAGTTSSKPRPESGLEEPARNTYASLWPFGMFGGSLDTVQPSPTTPAPALANAQARREGRRDAHGERTSAATSTGRSWYRAPYRSPFDPLFWMTPGHPVDHVQDWMAAIPLAAMMRGGLAASTGQSAFPWLAPWSAPWSSMTSGSAFTSPAQSLPGFDINEAYSAYRTAGGHAASQIVRQVAGEMAATGGAGQFSTFAMWPWLPQYTAFGWPPR